MEGECGLGWVGEGGVSPSAFSPCCPSPVFLHIHHAASVSVSPYGPPPSLFHISPPPQFGGSSLLLQFFPLLLPHPDSPFCTSPCFSPFSILPSTILPLVYCPSPLSLSPLCISPFQPPPSLLCSLFISISLIPLPASQTPPHT